MKTDFRVILSYCILGFVCLSMLLNIRGCGSDFDNLETENSALEKTRDSLASANRSLAMHFDSLQATIKIRDARIEELVQKSDSVSGIARVEKKRADRIQADLAETKRKIEEIRKNPANRKDEELIKSLKNKLLKK